MLKCAVHPALAGIVRDIQIDGDNEKSAAPYRVMPGLDVVIGFQFRGSLAVQLGCDLRMLAPAGVTGLRSGPRYFVPEEQTRTILIRLWPHGAYRLLGCSMSELSDQHIALEQIMPGVRQTQERIGNSSIDEIPSLAQKWLLDRLEKSNRESHGDLVDAVNRILASHGRTSVEQVADQVGVGRRQLERLFRLQIGVGPKEFASLARFNWILANWHSRQSWCDLAIAAGYADQAHFIRSFRNRTGVTPGEFRP